MISNSSKKRFLNVENPILNVENNGLVRWKEVLKRRKKDFKSSKFEVYKRRKTILNVEQMIVKDELWFWTLINVSYTSKKTIQNVE